MAAYGLSNWRTCTWSVWAPGECRGKRPTSSGSARRARVTSAWTTSREQDPFADYVVHEAAHVFHNCKRATVGLPATRRREWLLDIDYRKRETFAYACEAFSRMVALGGSQAQQREALVRRADDPYLAMPLSKTRSTSTS